MTNIIESLKWRYAVKKFDTTKEIPVDDLNTILEAGRLAPTAYGLQPFDIIVVTDAAKKAELVPNAYGQAHVADNSALIVLAVRTDVDAAFIAKYTALIETTRGLPAGSVDGFKDSMIGTVGSMPQDARVTWSQKQAYIALGMMMTAASEIKVDNHALEGFNGDKFDEVLGLTARNLHATVILALGYRDASDESQNDAKVRRSGDDMIIRM